MSTQRNARWFEDLYRTHHAAVLRYAVRRVGPDDADDVVAEVFTTAWRRLGAVGEPPLPWLYRAAHHHLLHLQRRRARGAAMTRRLATLPDAHVPGPQPRDPVLDLMDQLSDDDAELLRLVAWEQLTPAEIAYVLGLSAGTVRVRLHRARQRAQSLLAETLPDPVLEELS